MQKKNQSLNNKKEKIVEKDSKYYLLNDKLHTKIVVIMFIFEWFVGLCLNWIQKGLVLLTLLIKNYLFIF